MVVIDGGLSGWSRAHEGLLYAGQGAQGLLSESLTAFLSSRQCPGAAIRAAMDWALEQVRSRQPVVSAATRSGRLTEALAAQRNEWVVALARQIVVAHASPDGRLAVLCDRWSRSGRSVRRLG